MEVTVQGHNADSLLLTWGRHYRLMAHTAARSKLPVKGKKTKQQNEFTAAGNAVVIRPHSILFTFLLELTHISFIAIKS